MAFNPGWVAGKTIERVEMNAFKDPRGARHNPVIYFTDGSVIAFEAEELESGDGYGIDIIYRGPR